MPDNRETTRALAERNDATRIEPIKKAIMLVKPRSLADTDINWGVWETVDLPRQYKQIKRVRLAVRLECNVIITSSERAFMMEISYPKITESEVSGDSSPSWAGGVFKNFLKAYIETAGTPTIVLRDDFDVEVDVNYGKVYYRLQKLTYSNAGAVVTPSLAPSSIDLTIQLLGTAGR